jgi:diguanylate cyclase (GGDEF)-like protein/PAS domain S-box-containing protein
MSLPPLNADQAELARLRRFRAAIDFGSELVFLIDHETQRYLDANAAACRAANMSLAELLLQPPHTLLNTDADTLRALYDELVACSPETRPVEVPRLQPDGSTRVLELTRRAVQLDGRWTIVSNGRDVTRRRRAEEALTASERRQDSILQSIDEPYYEVDLKGHLVQFNDAFVRLVGRPADELVGVHYIEYVPVDACARVFDWFHEVYRSGVTHTGKDWPYRHVDGTVTLTEGSIHLVKHEITGEPIGFRGLLRDVTARRRMEATLRDNERRFRDLTQLSSDWYWEQDDMHRFTMVSDRIADSGLDPADCRGKTLEETGWSAADEDGRLALDAARAANAPFRNVVLRCAEPLRFTRFSGQPVVDAAGRFTGYRGTGSDVTQQRLADDRMRHVANHDVLTGLPNRGAFTEILDQAVACLDDPGEGFALLFIDLDGFKQINDAQGHAAGDEVLRITASRLRRHVRSSDIVARLGGDEFTVLLRRMAQCEPAEAVAQTLVHEVSKEMALANGHRCRVSASIGLCLAPQDDTDAQSLMRHADAAMYLAKQQGKNRWVVHAPALADPADAGSR